MSEHSPEIPQSLELCAYRIVQLEMLTRAQGVELFDLRQEREHFVRRAELEKERRVHRDLPVRIAAYTVSAAAVGSLILQAIAAAGGHG